MQKNSNQKEIHTERQGQRVTETDRDRAEHCSTWINVPNDHISSILGFPPQWRRSARGGLAAALACLKTKKIPRMGCVQFIHPALKCCYNFWHTCVHCVCIGMHHPICWNLKSLLLLLLLLDYGRTELPDTRYSDTLIWRRNWGSERKGRDSEKEAKSMSIVVSIKKKKDYQRELRTLQKRGGLRIHWRYAYSYTALRSPQQAHCMKIKMQSTKKYNPSIQEQSFLQDCRFSSKTFFFWSKVSYSGLLHGADWIPFSFQIWSIGRSCFPKELENSVLILCEWVNPSRERDREMHVGMRSRSSSSSPCPDGGVMRRD